MIDISAFQQGQKETTKQFNRRIFNAVSFNLKEISKRLKNESAEEHYDRFVLYQYSASGWGTLHTHLRDAFLNNKRIVYKKFDDEVINTMKAKPKESLEAHLARVDNLMIRYSDLINNEREDISETIEDRAARIKRFHDIRGKIKLEIDVKPLRDNLTSIGEAEKKKEKARTKVRTAALNKERDDLEKAIKKKKVDSKNVIKHKMFIFILLFGSAVSSMFLINTSTLDKSTVGILFGLVLFVILILSTKWMSDKLNSNPIYSFFMDIIFFVFKSAK